MTDFSFESWQVKQQIIIPSSKLEKNKNEYTRNIIEKRDKFDVRYIELLGKNLFSFTSNFILGARSRLLPHIVGRSNLSPTFCTMLLGFIEAFIPKYQSLQCTVKNINNCQCVRAHQGNLQNRLQMLNTNEPFFRGLFCDKEFQIFYKCKRYSIFVRCVEKNIFFH